MYTVVDGRCIQIPDAPITDAQLAELAGVRPGRRMIRRNREGNFPLDPNVPFTPREDETYVNAPPRTKGSILDFLAWLFGPDKPETPPAPSVQQPQPQPQVMSPPPRAVTPRPTTPPPKETTPSAPATTLAREAMIQTWMQTTLRRVRYIRAHAQRLEERFSKNDGEGIQLDPAFNWLIIPRYPMPERWRQRWTSLLIVFPTAYPDVPPTGFYLTIRGKLKNGKRDPHLFNGSPYHHVADLSAAGWHWYCVHAQVQGSGGWRPSNDPDTGDNLFTFLNMAREALTTDD
jgi:hypothetical protein